jgi:hypothetical protein
MKIVSFFFMAFCFLLTTTVQAQTSVLSTDFQTGIPATYTVIDNDGFQPNAQVSEYTDAWINVQDPDDDMNFVAGSTSYFAPIGTASRWLITPQLDLGAFGNTISWRAMSHDASFPDDYLVLVSTTNMDLESFTDTIGYVQEEYAEWTSRSVDLSAKGYNGLSIYIAFVNVTNNGFKLYLDDFDIIKEDPVGLTEEIAVQLAVFPNPFSDKLSVVCECSVQNLRLLDLSGKEIQHVNGTTLFVNELNNGVYLLLIESDKGTFTKKVVKN